MSFFSDQLAKYLNNHYAEIGSIENLDVGSDSVAATIRLAGETETLHLELTGIRWSVTDGLFNLHYAATSASRPWLQGLLNTVARKQGNRFSFPDKLTLMPLKMLFPKATDTDTATAGSGTGAGSSTVPAQSSSSGGVYAATTATGTSSPILFE
jgi:hypothetical protein